MAFLKVKYEYDITAAELGAIMAFTIVFMCLKRNGSEPFSKILLNGKFFQNAWKYLEILDDQFLYFMCHVWWKFIRDYQSSQGSPNRPRITRRSASPLWAGIQGHLAISSSQFADFSKFFAIFGIYRSHWSFYQCQYCQEGFFRPGQFTFKMVSLKVLEVPGFSGRKKNHGQCCYYESWRYIHNLSYSNG